MEQIKQLQHIENLQLIDRATVCQILRISNSTLWRLEKSRNFIRKIYLSPRRVAYSLKELMEWIERQSH